MLYELESRGLLSGVTTLIDISKLGLDYVKEDSSGLRIGASTTFTDALYRIEGHEATQSSV